MNTQRVFIPIAIIAMRLLRNTTKNTTKTSTSMRQRYASVRAMQLQCFLVSFAGCQDRCSKVWGAILCQQWAW